MEMERNDRNNDYRRHLLEVLRSNGEARNGEEGGSLHVLADQESIGELDHAGASLAFECRERPIHLIEVRTESGRLVGGLCVPENGTKAVRLNCGRATVELNVQATPDRWTVRASTCPTPTVLHRLRSLAGSLAGKFRPHIGIGGAPARWRNPGVAPAALPATLWTRAGVLAQVVLAFAVLVLVSDRLDDSKRIQERGMRLAKLAESIERQEAVTEEALEALSRQEQRLAKITSLQSDVARTLRAQEREIGGLQRVAQKVNKATSTHREAEAFFLTRLNDAAAERSKLQGQLRDLSASNEKLGREIAQLQVRTVVTEARLASQVEPFRFWVSFQEGVPEERIDQWVREIRGHKGPVNDRWYSVEVDVPQSQSKDRLLRSFQQDTDIVKAVKLSFEVPSNP